MHTQRLSRPSWIALGAVIGLAGTVLTTQAWSASASVDPAETTFVPITPCRLFDTRPAPDTVGPRSNPIGGGTEYTLQATGAQGECLIPSSATALAINLTAMSATQPTFVSLYPGGVENPGTSAANVLPGQSPTANEIQVKLSDSGQLTIFNANGTIDVIGDVLGYFTPDGLDDLQTQIDQLAEQIADIPAGAQGPIGPQGVPGDPGDDGAPGAPGNDGAPGLPAPIAINLGFQSTVTAVFGNSPSGVANGDTVKFELDVPTGSAIEDSSVHGTYQCMMADDCQQRAWTFPATSYVLTYSSGHKHYGSIDRIEITDGGNEDIGGGLTMPGDDRIDFYLGDDNVYEVIDFGGSWFSQNIPADLQAATLDIAQPALFDLTFYNDPDWNTYHYDYAESQDHTVVTRTP